MSICTPLIFPNQKAKDSWAQYQELKTIWKSLEKSEKAAIQCRNRKMLEAVKDVEDQAWHRMYWAYKDYCEAIGKKNSSMEFFDC